MIIQLPVQTEDVTPTTCIGELVGVDCSRRPLVDFEGNLNGPLAAISTVLITEAEVESGRKVVITFAGDRIGEPVIIGVIQEQPVVENPKIGIQAPRKPLEVSVDGQCLTLEAFSELRLKCGQSNLTLRKDGKIIIQGVNILSRAKMCNRVKGGSIHLN